GLALGIEQVTDVAGMDEIEHAMAHDHGPLPGARADRAAQIVDRLDLVAVLPAERGDHARCSAPRYWNQLCVARAIESASHNGASRQRSISATIDRKSTRLNSSHEWISYAVFC